MNTSYGHAYKFWINYYAQLEVIGICWKLKQQFLILKSVNPISRIEKKLRYNIIFVGLDVFSSIMTIDLSKIEMLWSLDIVKECVATSLPSIRLIIVQIQNMKYS